MEDKKSFILYADLMHTLEKLPDAECGQLFKHILRYVNDRNPETDNILVEIAFEPIRQQLKRDLGKWENMLDKRSDAGKKSAAKKQFDKWLKEHPQVMNISKDDHLFEASRCEKYRRETFEGTNTVDYHYYTYCIEFHQHMATKLTRVESVENNSSNSTVNDSVSVSVSVNVNDNVNDNVIIETPTPFQGDVSPSKKNDEVETKKRATKKTPAPKFEPDMSEYDEDTQGLILQFVEHRKMIGKPIKTDYAIKGFIRDLRKLSTNFNEAKELVEYMRYREWMTVNPIPQNYQKNGKPKQSSDEYKRTIVNIAGNAIAGAEKSRLEREERERRIRESSPGY